jgi:hypothetical protein
MAGKKELTMPTPAFIYGRNEKIFAVLETTYGTAATVTAASRLAHISCELDPMVDLYPIEWKTGSRGGFPGQNGRKHGEFKLSLPLMGSGVAGTACDAKAVLTAAFGTETVVADTSVAYTINDLTNKAFSLYRYRSAAVAVPVQQAGISCLVRRVTFNLGQNVANYQVEGICMWVLDSEQIASADTTAKGGLSSFPAVPTGDAINGTQAQGFVGSLSIDSNSMASVQSMTITADFGWDHVTDTFGSFYPTGPIGRTRKISAQIRLYDASDTGSVNLRAKALSKAAMDIGAVIGTTAGNIHTIALTGGQFEFPKLIENDDRWMMDAQSVVFNESTPGASDEIAYTQT